MRSRGGFSAVTGKGRDQGLCAGPFLLCRALCRVTRQQGGLTDTTPGLGLLSLHLRLLALHPSPHHVGIGAWRWDQASYPTWVRTSRLMEPDSISGVKSCFSGDEAFGENRAGPTVVHQRVVFPWLGVRLARALPRASGLILQLGRGRSIQLSHWFAQMRGKSRSTGGWKLSANQH